MAVSLVNLTGFTWGFAAAETGVNIEKLTVEVEPEINEWVPGENGQARGKVVGDPMGTLTMEGEIILVSSALAGAAAASFTTAFVPTASTTYFGRSAGGWYLDRGTIDNSRSALKKLSASFSSRFGVS